jgi:hypothetical protein
MKDRQDVGLQFIEDRGRLFCRGCLERKLFSGLDLGELPLANELSLDRDVPLDKFPLHLKICTKCGLGQVADVVTPDRIFKDYRYLSSMSTTLLQHASSYVDERVKDNIFGQSDWVLEIASNDGYLLKNFQRYGIKTIGIEPAENVAAISRALGIDTVSKFFSSNLAQDLLKQHGHPKLIIANNVMAHVPDLIDFVKGLAILCGEETQISIENPSLMNILVGMQFDTIYHEHYSYLSAFAVANISKMNGLQLTKVDELPIHGGSNRYWLTKADPRTAIHDSVIRVSNFEIHSGLFGEIEWANYASKVSEILEGFQTWLRSGKDNHRKIFGYGAAAKASTILNAIEVPPDALLAIADVSSEKQERFMPPNGTKIVSPQDLFSADPTDVVIFPWNIKTEIATYLRQNMGENVRLWCAIPTMHEIHI